MARTSTIRIRQSKGGTTIRATGSAAQALFEAITHSAESVQADPALAAARVLPLQIVVVDRNNTYEARAVAGMASAAAGLKGVKASCTAGRMPALRALLAKATPPRRVVRVVSQDVGPDRSDIYTIETEVL